MFFVRCCFCPSKGYRVTRYGVITVLAAHDLGTAQTLIFILFLKRQLAGTTRKANGAQCGPQHSAQLSLRRVPKVPAYFIRHFNAMEQHFFWPSFNFQEVAPNPWLADNLLTATKCHVASGDIYNDRLVLFTTWCCLPFVHVVFCGPGSSVGIATYHGLDGPGSNPGGDEIFLPSRPALGPTQSPVKWVPGISRG